MDEKDDGSFGFGYTLTKQALTEKFDVTCAYAGRKSGRDRWRVRLQQQEPAGPAMTATVSFDGVTTTIVCAEPVRVTIEPLSKKVKEIWQKEKASIHRGMTP